MNKSLKLENVLVRTVGSKMNDDCTANLDVIFDQTINQNKFPWSKTPGKYI